MCSDSSSLAPCLVQVITEAVAPHRIISVSKGWQSLCGFSREEVLGSTLGILQGPYTELDAIEALMTAVRHNEPVTVQLTNYTKCGEKFVHHLSAEPLYDPSGIIKCFQATSLVLQSPGEARCTVSRHRFTANTSPFPLLPLSHRLDLIWLRLNLT